MALRDFERVMTAGEKEKLGECYEHIAAHGLKCAILLEKHRQKMEQAQEMKLSM